jgi:hypothetical protein
MGQLAVPMMIGAAVGGGSKLLQGKGLGSILKGAAVGGALGGATGGVSNLLSNGATAATTATPSLLPDALAGTIESSGMVFNPATGSYLAPEAYLGATSANPILTAGNGLFSSMPSGIGVDNLTGAAQLASMYQPQPMQSAPSGRIEVGQAPTGAIYDELRKLGYAMPKRKETNFSLLG